MMRIQLSTIVVHIPSEPGGLFTPRRLGGSRRVLTETSRRSEYGNAVAIVGGVCR